MFHLVMLAAIAKEHQHNMLEEAKKYRMLKAARAARPRLQEYFFVRIGDFLISVGLRLKGRYEPAMCSGPEAYRSGC